MEHALPCFKSLADYIEKFLPGEQSKSPSYQFYVESSELGASVPLTLTFCFPGRGGRHAGELDQPEAGVPGDDAGPRR